MSLWHGGPWGSQRFPNGDGPWRGGLWNSQRTAVLSELDADSIRQKYFGAGQAGSFYLSMPVVDGVQVLWQDTSRTVPVTSDGEIVGARDDLSGNGNHLLQGTAGQKWIYHTDGTHHWLGGDGVDDFMEFLDIQYGQDWTAFSACRQVTAQSGARSVLDSDIPVQRQAQLIRFNAGKAETIAFNSSGTAFTAADPTTEPLGTDLVIASRLSSSNLVLRKDGVQVGSATLTGTPASELVSLSFGRRAGSDAQYFSGRSYGDILVADEAADFADAESYLQGLMP